eukprot:6230869-Prymnesium_polylepis.1
MITCEWGGNPRGEGATRGERDDMPCLCTFALFLCRQSAGTLRTQSMFFRAARHGDRAMRDRALYGSGTMLQCTTCQQAVLSRPCSDSRQNARRHVALLHVCAVPVRRCLCGYCRARRS